MTPAYFPEANAIIDTPPSAELPAGSVKPMHGLVGQIASGAFDGEKIIVVAWKPSINELKDLMDGGSVFLITLGIIPPHYIGTSLKDCIESTE